MEDKFRDFFTTKAFELAFAEETFFKSAFGGGPTFILLLAAFSILFVSYLSTRDRWNVKKYEEKRKHKGLDHIIGPKPLPFIGNLLDIKYNVEEMDNFFHEMGGKYPKRARYNILGENFVTLYNAEDIKEVLHSKKFIQKSAEYDVFKWIGKGVLTADENLWVKTRPLLDLGFRQRMLNNYRNVFCTKSMQLMEVLKERVSKNPEAFNIFPLLFDTGFDIISETVMNTPSNVLGGVDKNIYSPNMDRAADFFHYLHFRPFFYKTALGRFLWSISKDGREEVEVLKILNDFSENLINNRRKALEQEDDQDIANSTSLLDIMLLEQKTNPHLWTDKQIRDEVDTFLTGGHGATTATFGMFIQLMAAHPDIQEKVYAEVSSIFEGDPQRELTLNDLSKLKYTEMCIKECLRLYPGVPLFPRDVLRPLTLADGTVIPLKTTLLIVPFLLHRDPDVFPDPENFIPERFAPGGAAKNWHPYSWIPFSKGPRDCIGKGFSMIEMKVYVAYIINNFRLVKAVNTEDMTVLLRIFLKSKTGIKVKLERRE